LCLRISFFQLLEEEDTFPDDFIVSIEAMLAALDENTEMLFSESLSELNKLEATMRKASIE
jgi:glucose-6-phosphate isomerase